MPERDPEGHAAWASSRIVSASACPAATRVPAG
jgi:hypothetical protein